MKSPSFQFYPTDYLGSQRVQMMTLEEEGAYCRLLWSCWQHGSIPSDPELAARLVGKGCSTTVARVVLPMFEVACGDGRVTHDRLERERVKQAEWRAKSAAGGKKSAEMRQNHNQTATVVEPHLNGGSTVVQPPTQPTGNIPPSGLLFPSPKEEGEGAKAPERVKFEIPSVEAVKLAMAKAGLPSSEVGAFFDHYESNGWRIGKNKMVSWQHAIGNWARRKREFGGNRFGGAVVEPSGETESQRNARIVREASC